MNLVFRIARVVLASITLILIWSDASGTVHIAWLATSAIGRKGIEVPPSTTFLALGLDGASTSSTGFVTFRADSSKFIIISVVLIVVEPPFGTSLSTLFGSSVCFEVPIFKAVHTGIVHVVSVTVSTALVAGLAKPIRIVV